jgi:hypothetical protein
LVLVKGRNRCFVDDGGEGFLEDRLLDRRGNTG